MQKKVLIVAGGLRIGGAEKVARDIALYGPEGRYAFHYLVFGENIGEYEDILRKNGCEIFHFREPSENYYRFLKDLKSLMETQNYHIVHAHTMFSCGWFMALGWLTGIPVRITHAHSTLVERESLANSLYEWAMGVLIRRFATECLACSGSAGVRLYGKRFWNRRGKLLKNGIDQEKYCFSPENRHRIRESLGWENRFIIGHAGHLTAVKNQQFLLELLPEIRKVRPDAVLLLLGEGEDRAKLEERVRELGLSEFVRMPGAVPEVGPWLSAMDAFTLPSFFEGMPLALLEARANGLPCFVSDRISPDGLPLERPERWVEAVCRAKRGPGGPAPEVKAQMRAIYRCYEGAEP